MAGCCVVILSKSCALSALLLIEDTCGSASQEGNVGHLCLQNSPHLLSYLACGNLHKGGMELSLVKRILKGQ